MSGRIAARVVGEDKSLEMSKQDSCIFCQIVRGDVPCFKVFEDDNNLGFLDIFPNTEGFSVIVPKDHHQSDFALADEKTVLSLTKAARRLAVKIAQAYEDVDRCAVVMEGMMIDHLHAKIIPLHRTAGDQPSPDEKHATRSDEYFETYPGYITTKIMSQMADKDHLATIAARINAIG